MRNVTLRRDANSTYQLDTGSRFSYRTPLLAKKYKGVSKTEVSAFTNSASISIALKWCNGIGVQLEALFCYSA